MNQHNPEAAENLTAALLAEHHALQLQRRFRRKQPAADRDTLDQILWPIRLDAKDVVRVLDRIEDVAYDLKLDPLVLAHSTPAERQQIHHGVDEIQLLTLRFGQLRQLLDALDTHVDGLEAEVQATLGYPYRPWQPQTWSAKQLLEKFRLPDIYWPRLLRERRRRIPEQDDGGTRESAELDVHAGTVWLRQLLPKAELAAYEVGPMLTHLGVWALQVQSLPDQTETVRDAAKRILHHLRHLENDDDHWQIELLRTNRAMRLYADPLMQSPPQEDW